MRMRLITCQEPPYKTEPYVYTTLIGHPADVYTHTHTHTQVPGDNFVPGIVMGGLSGRLFGELLREAAIHPGLTPGAFALLGAGAVPASVLR